ncbi:hypothetical protein CO675_34740, partial [Bradyrhizobium sp. C9]
MLQSRSKWRAIRRVSNFKEIAMTRHAPAAPQESSAGRTLPGKRSSRLRMHDHRTRNPVAAVMPWY